MRNGKTVWILAFAAAAALGLTSLAQAGVVATEAQSIASWTGTPTIEAGPLSNTAAEIASTKYVRAQSFPVATGGLLDKVDVVYTTRNYGMNGGLDTLTVQLVELTAAQAAADSYPNTVPNLLTDGLTFDITEASDIGGANVTLDGSPKVLTLDFTDADEVTLEAGKTYALELFGGDGGFAVYRGSAWGDPYPDGKYYLCQDPAYPWDNDFGDRIFYGSMFTPDPRPGSDLAMAFYIVPGGGPPCHVGDANGDGEVGIADLSALADNYGITTGATWAKGDFNDDGEVGIADLSALADNYGWTGDPCVVPVPEPVSALILLAGLPAACRRRKRA